MSDDHPAWQHLFQQAPCGYLTTDDDGVVGLVNETFLRWSGHRREDVVGTALTSLMPVGDRILYTINCMPRLVLIGSVAEVALEIVGADGEPRNALINAVRTPAGPAGPATIAVVVFAAQQRRLFERDLLASRRRAEASEAHRAQAEAELRRLVRHDPLTDLPNRSGLTDQLQSWLGAGGPTRLAVLFLDVDHFKAVNDSLGHAAGDELLVEVGRRLRSAVRSTSTVARLSGDEFVVAEPVEHPDDAAALAQRLLRAVAQPVVVGGLELAPSASVGIALAEPDDDWEQVLHRADVAMYRAKAAGRGGFHVHDRTDPDPTAGRLQLLGELRHGIGAGELRVHYQPRIDLGTGSVDGVEALVRWQHPVRGLLGPAEFIEAAETSGLVRGLGAHVLDLALGQAARWQHGPLHRLGAPMAVNLSVRQLTDPELVGTVATLLERHGVAAATLTLEITETALMDELGVVRPTLVALQELGVRLSIDDFGTGYSSLTYLQRFPVDELKIDRSFVSGVAEDPSGRAIVAACIQLAHAMGSRAVAEGVETPAQRAALLELGCDLVQGYLCARPQPARELEAWHRELTAGLRSTVQHGPGAS